MAPVYEMCQIQDEDSYDEPPNSLLVYHAVLAYLRLSVIAWLLDALR